MIRRPPRATPLYSSAASDVYKRQLGDHLCPGSAARAGHRRRHQPEVPRTVVGEDEKPIALVIDVVFDSVTPGLDELGLRLRLVAANEAALAGHLARAREDHIALALGLLDAQLEALVILLHHQHVVFRWSA